jgi:bifunctional oligoribonuclease and PAP phosphatase NrnA
VLEPHVGAAVTAAADVLRGARTAVVTGHVDPDGDALGSLLALTAALRARGVDATPSWGSRHPDEPPAPLEQALSWLPCADLVVPPERAPGRVDVLVACDTATADRLGTAQPLLGRAAQVVVLDHHAVGRPFGDVRVLDPTASCTGVLVLRLLDALGVALQPAVADALYLALVTDTGRFGHGSTTAEDHRVAARLLEAGADHVRVGRAVYGSASRGWLPLVARVTGRAVVDDALAASWVTQADLAATGAGAHEPDGLVDLLRSVGDVPVACLLRETPSGGWRCSLRSAGAVDVAAVAAAFGGGGHRMAAGFSAAGDPGDVLDRVRALLPGAPAATREPAGARR